MRQRQRRLSLAVALVAALAIAATPVLAWQAEGGTKACGSSLTGKTRARANDWASIKGPGSSTTGIYNWGDGLWHTQERWGVDGGGDWNAVGDPYLDLVSTYAFCVA